MNSVGFWRTLILNRAPVGAGEAFCFSKFLWGQMWSTFSAEKEICIQENLSIVKQFRLKNVEKWGFTLSPPSLQGKHTSLTLFCNKLCIISSQLHPCLNRAHVLFHFGFESVHPENQKPQCNLLRLSQMFGYALRSGKHAGLWSHKAYLSWVWMGSCLGAKQLIPVINQQNKTRQDEIRINLILYVNISMASLALTFTFQMALIWTSIYLQGVQKKTHFQNHHCSPTIHPSPQAWLAGSGDLSDVSACRMMILKVRFFGTPCR